MQIHMRHQWIHLNVEQATRTNRDVKRYNKDLLPVQPLDLLSSKLQTESLPTGKVPIRTTSRTLKGWDFARSPSKLYRACRYLCRF